MNKLTTLKTILIGMVLILAGCFVFIIQVAPTLARLLVGLGVFIELFSPIVFLSIEFLRFWRKLLTRRKPTKETTNTPIFASPHLVEKISR